MKTVKLILNILVIGLVVASCNKEIPEPEPSTNQNNNSNGSNNSNTGSSSISFTSLESSETTISIGGTTQITAIASGDGLTYSWSTNSGDIIGSGSQITYGASGCCGGTNTVNCTVKDVNNFQESKSVTIIVQ